MSACRATAARFRRCLERTGEVMAYEISKTLHYSMRTVETPLGEAEVALPDDQIVIATILRAGLPFHQGFLNYFDDAQNAFVSAYRKYSKDGRFRIHVEYISTCELSGKTLLLVDPMLATGASLALTFQALVEKAGRPRRTILAAAIASEEGLKVTKATFAQDTSIWVRHGRLGADGQVVHRTRAGRRGRSGLRRQNVSVRRGSPLWPTGRIPSGRRSPTAIPRKWII